MTDPIPDPGPLDPRPPDSGPLDPGPGPDSGRWAWLLLSLLVAAPGCDKKPAPDRGLRVLRISPEGGRKIQGTASDPRRLFLNSRISVYFSHDLDPLSVASDTVRLVKVSGDRGVVRLRRVTVRSRSIILGPEPPVTPGLDDGSLQPGELYRLEIAGFPLTNTVTSLDQQGLRQRVVCYFRTVSADARGTDLPYPFLPVGTPADRFELSKPIIPMAAASGKLRLHFTLPLLPRSVRPDAFEIKRFRGNDATDLEIAEARVLSLPRPVDPYPGSTVELVLADPKAVRARGESGQPPDQIWVLVKPKGGVMDYRGRPPTGLFLRMVTVQPGTEPPLLRLAVIRKGNASSQSREPRPRFHPVAADCLGFAWRYSPTSNREFRLEPLARKAAGDGSHGGLVG